MKYWFKHILTLVLLPMVIVLQAQMISVQSKLSSDSMMIGDQLLLTIHVEAAKEVAFRMPVLADTLSHDLEVLAPYGADTIQTGEGRLVIEHSYMITGFEPGLQMVPAQRVIYSFNSATDTALSMPLMIQVYAPAVDTSQQIKAHQAASEYTHYAEGNFPVGRPGDFSLAGRHPGICPDLDVPATKARS